MSMPSCGRSLVVDDLEPAERCLLRGDRRARGRGRLCQALTNFSRSLTGSVSCQGIRATGHRRYSASTSVTHVPRHLCHPSTRVRPPGPCRDQPAPGMNHALVLTRRDNGLCCSVAARRGLLSGCRIGTPIRGITAMLSRSTMFAAWLVCCGLPSLAHGQWNRAQGHLEKLMSVSKDFTGERDASRLESLGKEMIDL